MQEPSKQPEFSGSYPEKKTFRGATYIYTANYVDSTKHI